jgi:hypothetical protein
MKFWKENKLTGEFEMSVDKVASAFLNHYWLQDLEHAPFPLERMLRSWLTATDGLNSVWVDETGPDSFEELFETVREGLRPQMCKCGYQAANALDLDQHVVLGSMHLPGDHG